MKTKTTLFPLVFLLALTSCSGGGDGDKSRQDKETIIVATPLPSPEASPPTSPPEQRAVEGIPSELEELFQKLVDQTEDEQQALDVLSKLIEQDQSFEYEVKALDYHSLESRQKIYAKFQSDDQSFLLIGEQAPEDLSQINLQENFIALENSFINTDQEKPWTSLFFKFINLDNESESSLYRLGVNQEIKAILPLKRESEREVTKFLAYTHRPSRLFVIDTAAQSVEELLSPSFELPRFQNKRFGLVNHSFCYFDPQENKLWYSTNLEELQTLSLAARGIEDVKNCHPAEGNFILVRNDKSVVSLSESEIVPLFESDTCQKLRVENRQDLLTLSCKQSRWQHYVHTQGELVLVTQLPEKNIIRNASYKVGLQGLKQQSLIHKRARKSADWNQQPIENQLVFKAPVRLQGLDSKLVFSSRYNVVDEENSWYIPKVKDVLFDKNLYWLTNNRGLWKFDPLLAENYFESNQLKSDVVPNPELVKSFNFTKKNKGLVSQNDDYLFIITQEDEAVATLEVRNLDFEFINTTILKAHQLYDVKSHDEGFAILSEYEGLVKITYFNPDAELIGSIELRGLSADRNTKFMKIANNYIVYNKRHWHIFNEAGEKRWQMKLQHPFSPLPVATSEYQALGLNEGNIVQLDLFNLESSTDWDSQLVWQDQLVSMQLWQGQLVFNTKKKPHQLKSVELPLKFFYDLNGPQ